MLSRGLGIGIALLSLTACGTIERPDPVPLRVLEGQLAPTVDPRIRAGDED